MLAHGRVNNPLYEPSAALRKGVHRIGEGNERSILISRIDSPQATIHSRKARGAQKPGDSLPTVYRSGSRFILHDGNHRVIGSLRAGKLKIKALVQ